MNNFQQLRPVRRHGVRVVFRNDPAAQPVPSLLLVGVFPERPEIGATQRIIPEIDGVAAIGLGRAAVDLVAADVRENRFGVTRVFGYQPLHFGDRRGDVLLVRIVESEPHAEENAALKAPTLVRLQPRRVVVAAAVEQEGGDRAHLPPIERPRSAIVPLQDVDHAHHHRRLAGPRDAAARAVDRAAVPADPAQAGGARVALGDGVGGDQPKRAALAQQAEGPAEEMRRQIGVAMAFRMDRLQPVGIGGRMGGGDRVLPREGRVADDGVETRIVSFEHLRELDLPVEGRDRMRSGSESGRQRPHPVLPASPAHLDGGARFRQPGLAGARFGRREEGGDHGVADQLRVGERRARPFQHRAQIVLGGVLYRFADAPAFVLGFLQPRLRETAQQPRTVGRPAGVPVQPLDAPGVEADQAVRRFGSRGRGR